MRLEVRGFAVLAAVVMVSSCELPPETEASDDQAAFAAGAELAHENGRALQLARGRMRSEDRVVQRDAIAVRAGGRAFEARNREGVC